MGTEVKMKLKIPNSKSLICSLGTLIVSTGILILIASTGILIFANHSGNFREYAIFFGVCGIYISYTMIMVGLFFKGY